MSAQEPLSIGSHGKAAYLLKESSKKKRSREEIEEVKAEEELLKKDKQGFLKEFKKLKGNQAGASAGTAPARQLNSLLGDLNMKGPDEYIEVGSKRKPV